LAELEQSVIVAFLCANRHDESHLLDREPMGAAPWQVRRAEEYIEAHWDQPITVDALAVATGASARSIFHFFNTSRGYGECRSPGVEHGGEPDAGAEMPGLVGLQPTGLTRGGDGDQGLGGGFEQQVIDDSLVVMGEVGDRPREGEDEPPIAFASSSIRSFERLRRPREPAWVFRHDVEQNIAVDQHGSHSVVPGERHDLVRAHRDIATAAQMGHKAGPATAAFPGIGADNPYHLAVEFELHLGVGQEGQPARGFRQEWSLDLST
jgi:hypothetical protein